jgi:hypothetical protein
MSSVPAGGFEFSNALRLARGTDPHDVDSGRGQSKCYLLDKSIVVSRARGHIDATHIESLIGYCDRVLLTAPTIEVFHDWFGVTSYDARVRILMTPWSVATRHRHTGVHIGLRSALVRMGVSLVVLASGAPVTTYASIATLGAALERASG